MKELLHQGCEGKLTKSHNQYYCSKCGARGDYWFTTSEDEAKSYLSISMGPPGTTPKKKRLVLILKGCFAIAFWCAAWVFANWYNTQRGYLTYWLVIAPSIVIILLISSKIKPLEKLVNRFANTLDWAVTTYEENMGAVGMLLAVLPLLGFLYLLIFAPYGLLCHL